MLKTVKDDICEMKTKFTSLESELHVSKTVTDNLTMKTSNIRERSVWRYQAFLVTSPTMRKKKQFWAYFQNVMPLSTLQILKITIDSNRLIMPLRMLLENSQNGKMCIEY